MRWLLLLTLAVGCGGVRSEAGVSTIGVDSDSTRACLDTPETVLSFGGDSEIRDLSVANTCPDPMLVQLTLDDPSSAFELSETELDLAGLASAIVEIGFIAETPGTHEAQLRLVGVDSSAVATVELVGTVPEPQQ